MNFCGIFTKIVNKNYIQELNNLNQSGNQIGVFMQEKKQVVSKIKKVTGN